MRRLVLLSVVALIALTEACAVGPGYRRSSLGMPDGWRPPATSEDSLRPFFDSLRTSRDTLLPPGADTARVPFVYDTAPRGRGDSAVALRWLDLVQDSVLRQLVDTSLRQNRDVRTALAVIDEFRAQYRATRVGLLPELTANGRAGRNKQVFGTFGSFSYDVYSATADLSWELDLWGRLRRGTSAARSDLVAREEDRRALQLSLIGDVATAYFDLRAADLNLAIARRTLDSRRQTLQLARRRLDQGLISELDVRQFEAEVAGPAANVADFERQVAQQENALSVLVGHNPGAIARGRSLTEMAARIPVPVGVPSALLERRPDVRSAEASLRAATARIGVAQAARLPTITLTGQYGSQSTEFSKWFASGTNIWQAFAGVSIPLFTQGRPGGEEVNIATARSSRCVRPRTGPRRRSGRWSPCGARWSSRTCGIRTACRATSTCWTPSAACSRRSWRSPEPGAISSSRRCSSTRPSGPPGPEQTHEHAPDTQRAARGRPARARRRHRHLALDRARRRAGAPAVSHVHRAGRGGAVHGAALRPQRGFRRRHRYRDPRRRAGAESRDRPGVRVLHRRVRVRDVDGAALAHGPRRARVGAHPWREPHRGRDRVRDPVPDSSPGGGAASGRGRGKRVTAA